MKVIPVLTPILTRILMRIPEGHLRGKLSILLSFSDAVESNGAADVGSIAPRLTKNRDPWKDTRNGF